MEARKVCVEIFPKSTGKAVLAVQNLSMFGGAPGLPPLRHSRSPDSQQAIRETSLLFDTSGFAMLTDLIRHFRVF
jgi:hypothetical protein